MKLICPICQDLILRPVKKESIDFINKAYGYSHQAYCSSCAVKLKESAPEVADETEDEKRQQEKEYEERQRALSGMLVTSGFSFDGFKITKYSGYISGDDAVQVDRGVEGIFSRATNVGDSLMSSLAVIRRHALIELKEAAHDLGCNAVIGVDFDYITLDPQTATSGGGTMYLPYVFGVTANGNAVVIEKI